MGNGGWVWWAGVLKRVSGCTETGEDERCREDERRGEGAEIRSAARLRRLSEDLALWLCSCVP